METLFKKPLSWILKPFNTIDKTQQILRDVIILLIQKTGKAKDYYNTTFSELKEYLGETMSSETLIRRLKEIDLIEDVRISKTDIIFWVGKEDLVTILTSVSVPLDMLIINKLTRYGITAFEYLKALVGGYAKSELTIDELRLLFCGNIHTHSKFKNFRSFILNPAFNDLKKTDLLCSFELIPEYKGGRYEKIKFHAEDKNKLALPYIKVAAIPKAIPQEPITYSVWKPDPYKILLMELKAQGLKGINGQRLIS